MEESKNCWPQWALGRRMRRGWFGMRDLEEGSCSLGSMEDIGWWRVPYIGDLIWLDIQDLDYSYFEK